MARIVPVAEADSTIGSALQIDAHVLLVSAEERVISGMHRIVSNRFAAIDDVIHLMAVKVVSEQMIAIFRRPVVAGINHRTDMRVATSNVIGTRLARAACSVTMIEVVHPATNLNSRIRDRESWQFELHVQFEVSQLTVAPDEPCVFVECLARSNFTQNGAVCNSPVSGVSFPAFEGVAIKQIDNGCS